MARSTGERAPGGPRIAAAACLLLAGLTGLALSGDARGGPAAAPGASFEGQVAPLLNRYCFRCHDTRTMAAGLDLSRVRGPEEVPRRRRFWAHLLERVEAKQMPPAGSPAPTDAERALLAGWIRRALAGGAAPPEAAAVPLPQLTRREYSAQVRDLLGVEADFRAVLPEDPEGPSGFTNDRASLAMTDRHLEAFLEAAELAVETLFAAARVPPSTRRFEAEKDLRAHAPPGQGRPVRLPDGTQGFAFPDGPDARAVRLGQSVSFPHPGTYVFRLRARAAGGPETEAGLWVAVDTIDERTNGAVLARGDRLAEYATRLFVPAGAHEISVGPDPHTSPWLPDPPDYPQLLLPADPRVFYENLLVERPVDVTWEEVVQLAGGARLTPEALRKVEAAVESANQALFRTYFGQVLTAQFHHQYGHVQAAAYLPEAPWAQARAAWGVLAATVGKGLTLEKLRGLWEGHYTPTFRESVRIAREQQGRWQAQERARSARLAPAELDWLEIEGPLPPAPGKRLPLERAEDVEPLLRDLLPRAFRRPLREADLKLFLGLYRRERGQGADHGAALRRTLVGVLVSPHFLYRVESPAGRRDGALDGHQLAARLAAFLWTGLPDDVLRALAAEGKLADEAALAAQAGRMLESPRLHAFARAFTEEWLGLSAIGREMVPDPGLFRFFSWRLAEDMREEVARVFERLLREDRSLLELLDSEETVLNERLARLYGIPGVRGPEMRPVKLPDRRRGGLLGMAAVLTATSRPTRTSPVGRGVFLLEKVLGQELPPPPPNAGNLPETAGNNPARTLREELSQHRSRPECAGCHARIDPLGFGLENFDLLGRWRTRLAAGPVDALGELPDGSRFRGVEELKQYLLTRRRDDFVRSLAERTLAYALGRGLEAADDPAVERIAAALRQEGYRARVLVREVVKSRPFRFREGREAGGREGAAVPARKESP